MKVEHHDGRVMFTDLEYEVVPGRMSSEFCPHVDEWASVCVPVGETDVEKYGFSAMMLETRQVPADAIIRNRRNGIERSAR